MDCIYEGARVLYINPDECVDCGGSFFLHPFDPLGRGAAGQFEQRFGMTFGRGVQSCTIACGSPARWWPPTSGRGSLRRTADVGGGVLDDRAAAVWRRRRRRSCRLAS